MSKQTGAVH